MISMIVFTGAVFGQARIDSLKQQVDSLTRKGTALLDSIEVKRKTVLTKIQSFPDLMRDSLRSRRDALSVPMSAIKELAIHKADSIGNNFSQITDKVSAIETKTMSLVNSKIDSVTSLSNGAKARALNVGNSKIVGETERKINSAASSASERINEISKQTGGKGNVPGSLQSPSFNGNNQDLLDKLSVNGSSNLKLPTPDVDKIDMQVPDIDVPASKLQIPSGKDINLESMNELKKNTEQATKISDRTTSYTKQVSKVRTEVLGKGNSMKQEIITKNPAKGDLAELSKQDRAIKDAVNQIKASTNREEYKKQTLARAKKLVATHLATQSAKIREAASKLNAYQNKAGAIIARKNDLPKKRDNWRRVKRSERFVPGLTMQLQKPGGWLVDFNPSIRYRLTIYWSIGGGWNQRVQFGKVASSVGVKNTFGPRAFSEVVLFKGFSFRAESEMMNARIPSAQSDGYKDVGVWNHQVGIKKDFSFIGPVKGNAQFLYNLHSSSDIRTYPAKYNVRFGFEIPLKKNQGKKKNL
jgi:hypothetical protein